MKKTGNGIYHGDGVSSKGDEDECLRREESLS
jgi:hypothetical protein